MPCIRTSDHAKDYNAMKDARKWWEEWDLRVLILYILIAQLYLLFLGRLRRRSKWVLMMIVNIWLFYLFSDLLATIALGKLSKIKVDDDSTKMMGNSTKVTGNSTNATSNQTNTMVDESLRVMWAPLILFYLGGPDTITVLRVDENKLWVRHLIGFLTQGLRTAYALIVTFNPRDLVPSLLALLVFIPGIIKYGERVWVVRSRSKLQLPKIDKIRASRPNIEIVLLAYSWFRTLMPRNTSYKCNASEVRNLVTSFRQSVNTLSYDAFKLIEIELGFIYDIHFSKVGTIFTVWGSILRFLSFTLIVSVLVIYITWDKPPRYLEGDHIITMILLVGAIFLEISGIVVQLVSDWAMVWACKNGSKWATNSVLFLRKFRISKSQRWSGVMGKFSLREFCENYKPTVYNRMWECLFGREKMLKIFCSQESPDQDLKYLIIYHLREKLWGEAAVVNTLKISTERVVDVGTSQTSTQITEEVDNLQTSTPYVKIGEWTLLRYDVEQQFKWSIEEEFEFGQSIVIWHVATEVCYESDRPGNDGKLKAVKILSDYMMYLLVACPNRFPFTDKYEEITHHYSNMKEIFHGKVVVSRTEGVDNESDTLVDRAQRLVQNMKGNPKRWDIMGSMWVEMLCYAARECPLKNHVQELRCGGEFLTHVWLLLLHFGVTKQLERSASSLKDEYDSAIRTTSDTAKEIEEDQAEKAKNEDPATNVDGDT